jgi:hypothetical protein
LEYLLEYLLESLADSLSEHVLEYLLEYLSEYLLECLSDSISEYISESLPQSGGPGRQVKVQNAKCKMQGSDYRTLRKRRGERAGQRLGIPKPQTTGLGRFSQRIQDA